MEEALKTLIKEKTNFPLKPFKTIKLAGEASYREYYRLQFDNKQSLVVMKMPAGYSSVSEEVTKAEKEFKELPFINVQRYLKSLNLPVPEIFAYSPKDGLLLLQDLGDQSLEKTIREASEELTLFFYKKALDLLAALQKKSREHPSDDCIAFFKKFDEELLNWEFDHFLEYGIEDRLNQKMKEADKKIFLEITRAISKKITRMPQGFALRDFQSRNLMICDYDFLIIDFQDALVGSVVYDLVSLLRDSYVQLTPEMVSKLQKTYTERVDKNHPYHGSLNQLVHDFDLQTIQRKLKDAGRFQYIKTVKKNNSFLENVPTSLKYVRKALERQTEYADLTKVLEKYLPEFR